MRALLLVVVVALLSANALEIQMPWNDEGLAVKSKMSLNSGFKTQAVVAPCATPNTCTAGVDSCSYGANCFITSTAAATGSCSFTIPYASKTCNATCNQAALDQCSAGTTCQGGYCTPLRFYGCACTTAAQCASQTCTNSVCVPAAGELKQWGWACAAASECVTGVCTAGKCAAIAAGGSCNPYNSFCTYGYYCMANGTTIPPSGTCVAVKSVGAVCSSDAECPNWANNSPVTCDKAPGNATGLCSTVLKAAGQSCNSSSVCALNLRCNPTTLVCESVTSASCDATYGDKVCPFGNRCMCSGANAMCMSAITSPCLSATVALASCLNSNPDAGYAQFGLYGPGYNPIGGTACGAAYATLLCQCSSILTGFSGAYFQQFMTCSSSGVGSIQSQTCPTGCLSSGAFPAVSVSVAVLFLLAIALFML